MEYSSIGIMEQYYYMYSGYIGKVLTDNFVVLDIAITYNGYEIIGYYWIEKEMYDDFYIEEAFPITGNITGNILNLDFYDKDKKEVLYSLKSAIDGLSLSDINVTRKDGIHLEGTLVCRCIDGRPDFESHVTENERIFLGIREATVNCILKEHRGYYQLIKFIEFPLSVSMEGETLSYSKDELAKDEAKVFSDELRNAILVTGRLVFEKDGWFGMDLGDKYNIEFGISEDGKGVKII